MDWVCSKTARSMNMFLFVCVVALCRPALGFIPATLPSPGVCPPYSASAAAPYFKASASKTSSGCRAPIAPLGSSADVFPAFGRRSLSPLSMAMTPAPPVKPPKRRGTGGGGGGDELFVRELIEPEKSVVLTGWRDYAVQDGGEKFTETIEIINNMINWRSGVVAARKRRFTLACCKGSTIQAVACVQIAPKNDSVRGFLAQEACMSVCHLTVDPASPKFKAGAHLCKEVKDIGKLENMPVSFDPIKEIYSGRFYAATLVM